MHLEMRTRRDPRGLGCMGRVALVALVAGGCGFLGDEPFRGRRTPDVAPWRDLGALTICEGSARIGAPDARPLGLCPGGTGPVACTSDADCASRERCTCGGCQIATCSSNDECSGGFQCNFAEGRCDRPCRSDGDCTAGEACAPGENICRGRCGTTADCQRGERCQDGACVVRTCASDANCGGVSGSCQLQRVPGDLREPSPLVVDGQVVLWVERRLGGRAEVWRAVGSDGQRFRFEPEGPVLAPEAGDAGRAGAPAVLRRDDGSYLAVYASGNGALRRATSGDGMSFVVAAQPLLAPSQPWEQAGLDAPALAVAPAGGLLLYYDTVDRSAIGVAQSSDGIGFSARPEPVLVPASVAEPVLWRDLDRIASPFAEAVEGPTGLRSLRLYFSARGRESGVSVQFGVPVLAPPNFSIGEAATLDGLGLVPWPFNPAFDRIQNFFIHPAELEPAVITVGRRHLLYYRGATIDESRSTPLSVAENPIAP